MVGFRGDKAVAAARRDRIGSHSLLTIKSSALDFRELIMRFQDILSDELGTDIITLFVRSSTPGLLFLMPLRAIIEIWTYQLQQIM